MRDSFSEKMRLFLLNGIPLLSSLVLMFLFFMPLSSVQLNYFRPFVGLICVYYWTLKREDLFGFCSAFIIGFLTDVYSSSPLGVNILLMMGVIAATAWLAHYFQSSSFGVAWFIFALICLSYTLSKWILLMIYAGRFLPVWEAFLGCFSTIMFYPLITLINTKIQNRFLPQEYIDE
jgi:rod shape-determining protein MreD